MRYLQARDFDQVDALYAQAARLLIARYGMEHVRTAQALQNQAFANLTAGQPAAAIAKMKPALKIYRRVLEPNHPNIAAAELRLWAVFTGAQERHAPALARLTEARRLFAELYGQGQSGGRGRRLLRRRSGSKFGTHGGGFAPHR